jgi:hypothetical protein
MLTGRRDGTDSAFNAADSIATDEVAAAERSRSAPSSICKGHISVRPLAAIVDICTVNSCDG